MKHFFTLLLAAIVVPTVLPAQNAPEFFTYKQGSLEAPAFTTNNFKCIGVGKGNVIWAGTQYGGLYLFDDSFHVWRKSDKLTNVFINDIKADGDSGIWIGQSGTQNPNTNNSHIAGGVNYFRLASDASSNMQFYSVAGTVSNADILSRNVRSLYLDKSRKEELGHLPRVWVAQGTSISSFKTKRGGLSIGLNDRFTPPYPETLFSNIEEGFETHRDATPICEAIGGDGNEVWVAARQNFNQSQIIRYDNSGKLKGTYNGGDTLLPAGFTAQAIYFDAAGNRWIGLKNGGLVIETGKGRVKMDWENLFPAGTQVNYNAITADESGNVYIGTSNGLLEYLDPIFHPNSTPDNPNSYRRYTTADGLPSNNITGIAYDKKNGRVLITSSGGVTFMNKREPYIKGVVFDVHASIDSLNNYAGLQRIPLSSEVRVTLLKDNVEEEVTTPDANGIFELKKAEDNKTYTVEVSFKRDGKEMRYIYDKVVNHTKMSPIFMPDSLIKEIKAFKPKMEKRCFPLKFAFIPELTVCRDGFNLEDYEKAFEPFYDANGVAEDHAKKVDNLANYFASMTTLYNIGGYATSLNTDMVANTMDAIESLSAFVTYSFGPKEVEDKSAFKLNKTWAVARLKALKEVVNAGLSKVGSTISNPDTKSIFDQAVTSFNDAADFIIDGLDLNDGENGNSKLTRKVIIDNAKKLIASELGAIFYKNYYALTRHYDFVPGTSSASADAKSKFTYIETFDNLYNPTGNSLNKYGKDTLDHVKGKIETLGKISKWADAVAAVADAATALALVPGGQLGAVIAKGVATTAKVVKTAALTDAMYQAALGCYQEVLLSDKIRPQAGLQRGAPGSSDNGWQNRASQDAPAKLLARKNSYNQKLTELQAIYNAPVYDSATYFGKFEEFVKEDSAYTDEMTKTLSALWASTDSAITRVGGFKQRLSRVIDSFVLQQYTLRNAMAYQNDAFMWAEDKKEFVGELNNMANEVKILNDSAINGITYLVEDINTSGVGAPAHLVQDGYKIDHNRQPGSSATVTYTFKNYGAEPQTNVSFKISQPTEGFVLTSAEAINAGTIQPGETKQISYTFTSPAATDSFTIGRYQIDVKADNGNFKDVSGSLYIFKADGTLPVHLSAFDVTCSATGNKLAWKTASEANSSHFDIEKSTDGARFVTLATNKAAGNSTLTKNYQFVDAKGGTAFYRLKQVDKDGRFTYSAVQRVNCTQKQAGLLVYPVPAKNLLNIVVEVEKNTRATVILVDVLGRVARNVSTEFTRGTNNFKLSVTGLPAGQYFLRVVGSGILKTHAVTITQ